MSIYLLVFLLLAAGTLLEYFRPQTKIYAYWICWAAMMGCLCLRFGQGTDYVTYQGLYETIPVAIDLSQEYFCGFYPEIGWRLLSAAFKMFDAPFWVFASTLGLAEMLLLHRFVKRFVQGRTAGLFMLYPVLYLVYMVSGLRQGLAVCLFLGIALPFLMERKWIAYVITIFLTLSFHRVAFAWLVLIPAVYLPVDMMMALSGVSAAGGLILQFGPVEQLLARLIPVYHVQQFLLEGEVSWFAIGERLAAAAVLTILYLWTRKKVDKISPETEALWKTYLCGVCAYLLLCSSSYYASRYGAIFEVVECALVVDLAMGQEKIQRAAAVFFFCLTCLMGLKNLNAMTNEGGYAKLGYHFWNYPYVSIFHQEKIEEYFGYQDRVQVIYDANIEDQELWRLEK